MALRPFWILPENGAFPKEDSGGVLWVFSHSPTESNSVEKPLLTFVSIKKYIEIHIDTAVQNIVIQ